MLDLKELIEYKVFGEVNYRRRGEILAQMKEAIAQNHGICRIWVEDDYLYRDCGAFVIGSAFDIFDDDAALRRKLKEMERNYERDDK